LIKSDQVTIFLFSFCLLPAITFIYISNKKEIVKYREAGWQIYAAKTWKLEGGDRNNIKDRLKTL